MRKHINKAIVSAVLITSIIVSGVSNLVQPVSAKTDSTDSDIEISTEAVTDSDGDTDIQIESADDADDIVIDSSDVSDDGIDISESESDRDTDVSDDIVVDGSIIDETDDFQVDSVDDEDVESSSSSSATETEDDGITFLGETLTLFKSFSSGSIFKSITSSTGKTGLSIRKEYVNTDVLNNGINYDLEGAEYTIYSDFDCSNVVQVITSDSEGVASTGDNALDEGTYYVVQTKASEGYLIDTTPYVYKLKAGTTADENLQVSVSSLVLPSRSTSDIHVSESVNVSPEDYDSLRWSGETTDEILDMIDKGLNLETFFSDDLTEGITKEDLIKWKNNGRDINDMMIAKVKLLSNNITYNSGVNSNNISNVIDTGETDENGNTIFKSVIRRYLAAAPVANSDGKYYVTYCKLPDGREPVNLNGTAYDHALFNPKTGSAGEGRVDPWRIEVGESPAMCVSYSGHASAINPKHTYVESNINNLKNKTYSPHFQGGSNYPIEAYLKGVCYAYERLLGEQNLAEYPFYNDSLAWDASYHELCEAAGAEMVLRSDWNFNSAVLQIITWRIAQGSFNPNNMAYEKALAEFVYDQMYPSDIWGDDYSTRVQYFYEYYMKCAIESASGNYAQKYSTVKVKYWAVQGDDSENWQDFITWNAEGPVPSRDTFKVTKYGKLITASIKYPNATFRIYSDSARTHQIGVFTTDANGEATINVVQGVYYLKEITAPTGMILDDKLITLNVTGNTVSADVTNEEVYNGLVFQKFDTRTGAVIPDEAKFGLYEYVNGSYMRLCDISFTTSGFTGSTVTVPAYSYYIKRDTTFTYHKDDGTELSTVKGSYFSYTPINQGKFKIIEEVAPAKYKLNVDGKTFKMNMKEKGHVWQFTTRSTGIPEAPKTFKIKLTKSSALRNVTDDNACYSLQGAEYTVYSDSALTTSVGKIVTDANGKGSLSGLRLGTYYVKETKASTGYELDPKTYTVSCETSDEDETEVDLNVKEQPGNDPAGIEITKIWNGAKTPTIPTLEGTQFTICYYDGYYNTADEVATLTPKRTWVIEAKKNAATGRYIAGLSDTYLVADVSDELYRNTLGGPVIPYGTITIQETKPAAGYTLNGEFRDKKGNTILPNEIYISQVKKENGIVALQGGNVYESADDPKPIRIEIFKHDSDDNPLENVVFEIKDSDGNEVVDMSGNVVGPVSTDTDGKAVFDNLYPNVYVITEVKTVDGLQLLKEPITVYAPMRVTEQEIRDNNIDRTKCVYDEADDIYYIFNLTYDVNNTATFEMPMAGGTFDNRLLIPLGAGMILLGCVFTLVFRKKKRA